MITIVIFLLAALHFARRIPLLARLVAFAAWSACGALSIQLRTETPVPNIDRFLDGQDVTVTAHVVGEGDLRLWSRRIRRLDAVVVTDAHSDHMAGMFAILKNFQPGELWIGALPESTAFAALLEQARRQGTRIVQQSAGKHFAYASVRVDVLWPPRDDVG